ncbi:Crp/Fnr family transcriptional regulator [Geminicoccus flavidas]|uniref:Crp/Fnr family transcriptional regulator n=1 Tax=Geminicoccus flavidas TaxID=2506407 RepID=UPI001358C651|nr:cyclic nucleotide-binding domain-containing protein [Geminicoccus flavidas]
MELLLDTGSLRERIETLPVESFAEGETILVAGTSTGKLFILVSGTAQVTKQDVPICQLAEPGTVLGEISALLGQPHTADVTAVTACSFRVADAAGFLRCDPVAALFVATVMAKRLATANEAMVELRHGLAEEKPRGVIGRALDRLGKALAPDVDPELARYMYAGWM